MKHFLSLILAAVLTLSLTACDRADNSPEDSTESSGTESTEQTQPEVNIPDAGLTDLSPKAATYSGIACGTESGMYYMDQMINRGDGTLMYIDYATKNEVYVCSDSSCKHDSDRCTSYFSSSEFFINRNSIIFSYGGSLFYLNLNGFNEGGAGTQPPIRDDEERVQALYRMNPDGSGRSRVYTFDEGLAVDAFAAGDGNYLWFYVRTPIVKFNEKTKMYYSDSKNKAMIKLDLSDYTVVEQIPLKNSDRISNYNICGCFGDKFIFSVGVYPEGITSEDIFEMRTDVDPSVIPEGSDPRLNEIDENTDNVYFTLDKTTKETKEIFRCSGKAAYGLSFWFSGETMYVYDYNDDSLAEVNIRTGEKADRDMPPLPDGYKIIDMPEGKFLCVHAERESKTIYFFDPLTNETTKSDLRSPAWHDTAIDSSVVAFGSDYVLILGEEKTIENKHFGTGGYYYGYYVMTIDDFFNGVDKLEPVKINEREDMK